MSNKNNNNNKRKIKIESKKKAENFKNKIAAKNYGHNPYWLTANGFSYSNKNKRVY